MKLYIINPTYHHHSFQFRMPENPKLIILDIPAGNQLKVFEGSEDDCKFIVEQHAPYGMTKATEATSRTGYHTLLWSDRPVAFDVVRSVNAHNNDALDDSAAEERRKLTAATAFKTQEMQQNSVSQPKTLEVSVTEKGQPGQGDKQVQTLKVENLKE